MLLPAIIAVATITALAIGFIAIPRRSPGSKSAGIPKVAIAVIVVALVVFLLWPAIMVFGVGPAMRDAGG